jgi:hypothetical protein
LEPITIITLLLNAWQHYPELRDDIDRIRKGEGVSDDTWKTKLAKLDKHSSDFFKPRAPQPSPGATVSPYERAWSVDPATDADVRKLYQPNDVRWHQPDGSFTVTQAGVGIGAPTGAVRLGTFAEADQLGDGPPH